MSTYSYENMGIIFANILLATSGKSPEWGLIVSQHNRKRV